MLKSFRPRISLGMPVYNGQNFLTEALESVLAQSCGDFELVISDNASADATEEICRDFAERDQRIRFIRQRENRGAVANFNEVVHQSTGELFKWVAHDDLIASSFLERCLEQLDAHPETVLAMPKCAVIDECGREIVGENAGGTEFSSGDILTDEHFPYRWQRMRSVHAYERYRGVLLESRRCYELFGLIRRDALSRTPLLRPFPNSEKVLLTELALLGPWSQVDDVLFFSRWHRGRFTNSDSVEHRNQHWNPERSANWVWPHQPRCAWNYLVALWRYPLPFGQRMHCLVEFARFVFQVSRWPVIARKALHGTGMTVTLPTNRSQ